MPNGGNTTPTPTALTAAPPWLIYFTQKTTRKKRNAKPHAHMAPPRWGSLSAFNRDYSRRRLDDKPRRGRGLSVFGSGSSRRYRWRVGSVPSRHRSTQTLRGFKLSQSNLAEYRLAWRRSGCFTRDLR